MFLLNIAADDALLIKSGKLFHKRLPRNFMESMPNVMLLAAGICSRSLVLRSYLMSFLIKYSCIKGKLILLSVFAYLNHKHTKVLGMDICFTVLC